MKESFKVRERILKTVYTAGVIFPSAFYYANTDPIYLKQHLSIEPLPPPVHSNITAIIIVLLRSPFPDREGVGDNRQQYIRDFISSNP